MRGASGPSSSTTNDTSTNIPTDTNENASNDSKMSATDINIVENTATASEDKISKGIQENWKKQYNYETGYRCDNWVEEVLKDAGYDSSDYLTAGNSYEKKVQQHIDALVAGEKAENTVYKKDSEGNIMTDALFYTMIKG